MTKQINNRENGIKNTSKISTPVSTGKKENTTYNQGINNNNYNSNQFNIVQSDSLINKYKLEEDFTKDIRMYNLIFYQTTTNNGDDNNMDMDQDNDINNQNIILTIKPNKCK